MNPTDEQLPTIDFRKEDLSSYAIHSATEILAYVNAMAEKNLLTTVTFNTGTFAADQSVAPEFFVSTILEVDEEDNQLIIDCAQAPAMNLAATQAASVTVEALLDKIRIAFTLQGLKLCTRDGKPALQAELPASLVRLQRRQHFRISPPIMHPVECTIVLEKPSGPIAMTLKPHDLSFGGLGLFDDKDKLDDRIGQRYENCRINLPGVGIIYASLQVTNAQQVLMPNGQMKRRIGLGFLKLSVNTGMLLQRYIILLEREQNARRSGLA